MWSDIWGTHFGDTKAVASTVFKPLSTSLRTSSSFCAVSTRLGSFCSPSLGPTSTMRTSLGRLAHAPESAALAKLLADPRAGSASPCLNASWGTRPDRAAIDDNKCDLISLPTCTNWI